jgi:hypothetical protein
VDSGTFIVENITRGSLTVPGRGITAVPAAAIGSAPGLAGTAGIQPQLNVDALTQWAQGISGAEAAADLIAATS